MSRGEVRLGVLAVLEEQPMHGYQIMQELEDRSGGAWQPSPGSIYPTLQQLADEGLVTSESVDGKNVFSLTEDGQTALSDNDGPRPWERFEGAGGVAHGNLRRSVHQLGAAARQVAMTGTPEHVEAANRILADARKALYRLLAEDDAAI
ncbi:MAG: PadR family transcriptional regulator [Actinomycetota bacterium]